MNKLVLIAGFVVMVLAQWFVPANMIFKQEQVLSEGTSYKFKTQPIDPNDPFRGKYIVLSYEMNRVAYLGDPIAYGETAYVYIKKDAQGFAEATHAAKQPLESNQDFITVRSNSVYQDSLNFTLPFTTFYMNENKAYDAEVAVREAMRDSLPVTCYGIVYVKEDRAVLHDVMIDEVSIKEYVEKD